MNFLKERARKITDEIKNYIFTNKVRIEEFVMKEGHFKSPEDVDSSQIPWKTFKITDRWGGIDKNYWFRCYFTFPKNFDNKYFAVYLFTGAEGWDAINPQFMLYLNGKLIQGVDVNHREVIFYERAKAGQTIQIDLHAYSGMVDKKLELYLDVCVFEEDVSRLYFNLDVPLQVVELLPDDNQKKWKMINIINETINIIDLRKPLSEEFFESIRRANQFIEKELYEKYSFDDVVATCIGHSHIDVAWLWRLDQTRQKAARTFATMLKLMEEYPEFVFIASQPQLYKFVKEDYPEVYEKIRERIREGRWEAEGGMWLEADCNLTSGESLVRQLLYGKKFFKEEFGIDSKIL